MWAPGSQVDSLWGSLALAKHVCSLKYSADAKSPHVFSRLHLHLSVVQSFAFRRSQVWACCGSVVVTQPSHLLLHLQERHVAAGGSPAHLQLFCLTGCLIKLPHIYLLHGIIPHASAPGSSSQRPPGLRLGLSLVILLSSKFFQCLVFTVFSCALLNVFFPISWWFLVCFSAATFLELFVVTLFDPSFWELSLFTFLGNKEPFVLPSASGSWPP